MKAMLLIELKELGPFIVMVCITSKNLINSNHNDDTNMLLLYLFYNYHMLRLLLLDKDFYLAIYMHDHYCTNELEALPKLLMALLEMLIQVSIMAILDKD